MMTVAKGDLIYNLVTLEQMKKAPTITDEEINAKVAELFPAEKLEQMKKNMDEELNKFFASIY